MLQIEQSNPKLWRPISLIVPSGRKKLILYLLGATLLARQGTLQMRPIPENCVIPRQRLGIILSLTFHEKIRHSYIIARQDSIFRKMQQLLNASPIITFAPDVNGKCQRVQKPQKVLKKKVSTFFVFFSYLLQLGFCV